MRGGKFWKKSKFLCRLNNGDKKVYLEVYDFFAPKIFRFLYYKTGKNKDIAEDLTQQTFFKTWEYILHLISSYLFMIFSSILYVFF